jgi:hypothetical protein
MGCIMIARFIFGNRAAILLVDPLSTHRRLIVTGSSAPARCIPGTTPFDGVQAMKGYALNKMCFSFNDAANRAAFLHDEEAYMRQYGLTRRRPTPSAAGRC